MNQQETIQVLKGQEKLRGLGDAIAKVTTAIGIKPCGGCKKRQEMLNKVVPFKRRQPR